MIVLTPITDSCNSYIEIEKKKLEIMKEDLILKKEIVAIKKMRAEQEERKVRALEEITNSLKMPTYQIPGLSPVINIR